MALPNFERTTPPAEEPLTVAEAKEHMRVRSATDDDYIERLIVAARSYLEAQWGLALVNQTWTVTFDSLPDKGLSLRPFPAQSLASVSAWNGTTFAAQDVASYQLIEGRPAKLFIGEGGTPATPARTRHGMRATFVAGFGADADAVPSEIKQAMLLLIGHWYENREASVSATTGFGVSAPLSRGVEDLMAPYRSPRLV